MIAAPPIPVANKVNPAGSGTEAMPVSNCTKLKLAWPPLPSKNDSAVSK
jgi:hypothetical protein